MSSQTFAEPFLYLSQGFVLISLTLFLMAFYYGFGRQYVKLWMMALGALSVNLLISAFEVLAVDQTQFGWSEYLISASQHTFFHLFVLYFLQGLYGAKLNKRLKNRVIILSSLSVITFTFLLVSVYAFEPLAVFNRFYATETLPAFIVGCLFIAASFGLLVHQPQFFASRTLMSMMALLGLRYLIFSFTSIVFITEEAFHQFRDILIFFDTALFAIIGFIVLIWLQSSERKNALQAIDKATYLGKHDSLTGALNRKQVIEKLPEVMAEADRESQNIAIFLIDIKRFKFINDSYGLKTGDYILGEIANRLNNSVLLPSVVGRLSGDSFVFVVENQMNEQLTQTSLHLHELIARGYYYQEQEIELQCSIGVSIYPDHGTDVEDLLQKSNLALFHAESENIPTVIFEDGMQSRGRELIALDKDIRRGLNQNEFVLYYQPQLNLLTNRLEGVEALIRWQHPEKGILSPAHFLDDIEALGLNAKLDKYVLDRACDAISRWHKQFQRKINVAVNISAVEFQDPKLVTRIQALLFKYDIPPKCLELEITENVVITDIESAMATIVLLQNMGIKVSIDDFGTGYSSLAYLRKLPIDKIKIDQSFIKDVNKNDSDVTIVKSMIRLSHGLGKRVLAEGVEDVTQLELLRELSCDAVQGYYISKPLTEEELQVYFKR